MARRAGNVPGYYWHSISSGARFSWFFASRKEAEAWRNTKYYKYVEYGSIEYFLATVPESRKTKETEIWKRHKAGYLDLELRTAKILYDTEVKRNAK